MFLQFCLVEETMLDLGFSVTRNTMNDTIILSNNFFILSGPSLIGMTGMPENVCRFVTTLGMGILQLIWFLE